MGFVGNYVKNLGNIAFGREPIRPLLFSYYITHRCTLNCRYCCDGDGKRFAEDPIPELTTDEVKRLLSILRAAGDTLDITGGEPLLRDDLEEILAYARAIGFRTVLNTKGIGLTTRKALLENINVLVVSIDTLDPDKLATLVGRPRSTAEAILASLGFVLEQHGHTDAKLVLSVVATPDNLVEVSTVMDFAMEHSLGFQVSPEIVGTTANPLLRENAEYRKLIDRVLAMKKQRRGILGVPEYLSGIRDFGRFCCHPMLMPVVRPDGRMYYPCLEWKQAEIDLLEVGDYFQALSAARRRFGAIPDCQDCCHIFCHAALSLLQTHPLSALAELRHWNQ
jgi:MoaA/NifB/PqqE/SkfB family radical SAM enzyme